MKANFSESCNECKYQDNCHHWDCPDQVDRFEPKEEEDTEEN